MKQTQNQSLRQILALSQHMQTSLNMLKMGAQELAQLAQKEISRNPFLSYQPAPQSPISGSQHATGFESAEIADRPSQSETLLQQIGLLRLNSDDIHLAKELVFCLDERGFLTDSIDEMSLYLDVPKPRLKKLIEILQNAVEPAGVFATNLPDCFRLQLIAQNRFDPLIAKLLTRLDMVAKSNLQEICILCDVDEEDAVEMLQDIRNLRAAPFQPVPEFSQHTNVIDLFFDLNEDQIIKPRLNPDALPKLLTDDGLFNTLSTVEMHQFSSEYYKDCYRSAAGFVVAMQKRANTLLRIGEEIAKVQQKFLRTNRTVDRQILTMGTLANTLSLNKSTISRALSNCSFATQHGILNPMECFVRPVSEDNGERTREQIMQRISVVIRSEDKSNPHSDEEIAQQLTRFRFNVSRRTVAKYRKGLGIKGAYARKLCD